MEHAYAVIMAGGGGTRLWPVSRKGRPKQLLPLLGEETLFQETVNRLEGLFDPAHILVVTVADQAREMQQQAPAIPAENYLIEPSPRGTASVVGLAATILHQRDPQAMMAILTADHFIRNRDLFHYLLNAAFDAAEKDYLVTLGITPTYPSTAYALLRYGNARELVLGLEAVLPDGQVFGGLRSLRKDNTGYDLKHLFIGAEGTLGVVTAAVLKLFPMPRSRATAFAAVADVEAAVRLLGTLRDALADRLVGFELMSAFSAALSRKHHPHLPDPLPGHPWYVLIQADDAASDGAMPERVEAALARGVEAEIVQDATVARSDAQAAALWSLRENISEGQRREGPNVMHDISLPVSAIPRFLDEAAQALRAAFPGVRFVNFGHLGDGNLHYNLSAPEGEDATAFMANAPAANRIVHDLGTAHGGSISAEHGIGQLKRDELARYKSALELELMRRVKVALDPQGLMNPGKVL